MKAEQPVTLDGRDTTQAVARVGYCMGCHSVHRLVDFLCVPCARRVDPDYARLVRRVHEDPSFAAKVHERMRGSATGERFVRELGYVPGEEHANGAVRCPLAGPSSSAWTPLLLPLPTTTRRSPSF